RPCRGLPILHPWIPRLAPWAIFCRCSAAIRAFLLLSNFDMRPILDCQTCLPVGKRRHVAALQSRLCLFGGGDVKWEAHSEELRAGAIITHRRIPFGDTAG